jgi:hypothetical protein
MLEIVTKKCKNCRENFRTIHKSDFHSKICIDCQAKREYETTRRRKKTNKNFLNKKINKEEK